MANELRRRLGADTCLEIAQRLRKMATHSSSAATSVELARLAAQYEQRAARAGQMGRPEAGALPLAYSQGVSCWQPLQERCFQYDRERIVAHAPGEPGVYAVWTKHAWIYLGEAGDIRSRLLQHLTGDDECIRRGRPTAFSFEVRDDLLRAAHAGWSAHPRM